MRAQKAVHWHSPVRPLATALRPTGYDRSWHDSEVSVAASDSRLTSDNSPNRWRGMAVAPQLQGESAFPP
jgi:hypothetical protein